jgi:hypothetical protein
VNATIHCCILPPQYAIDYEFLLQTALDESHANISLFLYENLPSKWSAVYVKAVAHPTNIVHFRFGTFEYICDLNSQSELVGEVSFDQTIKDRVVAVFGTSACASDGGRKTIRNWSAPSEEVFCTERDNGHFIAHCIGGGLDLNVFSQERRLNRGWSPQGKIYRQMETYCYQHPGTFCFSRPIYEDGSNIPRWLEFGLLKEHETLWIELFDNG